MAFESKAILRSNLLSAMKAKTVKDCIRDIRVMCDQDDIDAAEREYHNFIEEQKKQEENPED